MVAFTACSGSDSGSTSGAGGTASVGGKAAVGGVTAMGGTSAAGGFATTGGIAATGGARATGGLSSTAAAGGANSTGGAVATGGNPLTGGTSATGGTLSTGGGPAIGGTKATGGISNVGGTKATGGASSVGGSTSTGVVKSPGCGLTTVPAACSTSGSPCTVTINALARTYYVVLPANYDPKTAYPVVTGWHYYAGTAEQLLPNAGASGGGMGNFYGVRQGFPNAIYTTAQGLPQAGSTTNYVWDNTNGQDVAFARAIVAYVEANYCVDQSRIFAEGMSYGGIMSSTLGCQAPDIFRALGIIAGGIFGSTSSCMNHPIAAWFTHGDADATVPFATGQATRDKFIQDNGCSTTNTQSVVLNATTTCTIYNNCTAGNYPVVWCPVVGGTHTIPSFSAAEITKFFLQF